MTSGSQGVSYPKHDITAVVVESGHFGSSRQGHEEVDDDEAAFKEARDSTARSSGEAMPKAEDKKKDSECIPCGVDEVTENAPIKVARDTGEPTADMWENILPRGICPTELGAQFV